MTGQQICNLCDKTIFNITETNELVWFHMLLLPAYPCREMWHCFKIQVEINVFLHDNMNIYIYIS